MAKFNGKNIFFSPRLTIDSDVNGAKIKGGGVDIDLTVENKKIIIPPTSGDTLGVTTGVGTVSEQANTNGNITLKSNRIIAAYSPVDSYASLTLTAEGESGFYYVENCVLIWQPNATPSITDNIGLVYIGDHCNNGAFTPIAGAVYKIEFEIATVPLGAFARVTRLDSDAAKKYISDNYVSKSDLATYGMWKKLRFGAYNWSVKMDGNKRIFYITNLPAPIINAISANGSLNAATLTQTTACKKYIYKAYSSIADKNYSFATTFLSDVTLNVRDDSTSFTPASPSTPTEREECAGQFKTANADVILYYLD